MQVSFCYSLNIIIIITTVQTGHIINTQYKLFSLLGYLSNDFFFQKDVVAVFGGNVTFHSHICPSHLKRYLTNDFFWFQYIEPYIVRYIAESSWRAFVKFCAQSSDPNRCSHLSYSYLVQKLSNLDYISTEQHISLSMMLTLCVHDISNCMFDTVAAENYSRKLQLRIVF